MDVSEILDALTAELRSHGVTDWRVERRSKHPSLVFAWQGGELRYIFAGTSAHHRAPENAASELRRMMGVKRVVTKSDAPKRTRNRTTSKTPLSLETFARENPLAALSAAKDKANVCA